MPPLLLPSALFVTIRFQALLALVLVHLETTFLFEIAHGIWSLGVEEGKGLDKQPSSTPVKRNLGPNIAGGAPTH